MMNYIKKLALIATVFGAVACSEEETVKGPKPTADFNFEVSEEKDGTVAFTAVTEHAVTHVWDFGDKTPFLEEQDPTHKYAAAGTYNVSLIAIGESSSDSISKEVTVEIEIKEAYGENLVKGGDMTDASLWTPRQVWTDAGNEVAHAFANEAYVFNIPEGNEYSCAFLYQKVSGLEAGKTYKFNADLTSTGINAVWFDVFFGTADPETDGYDKGARVYVSGENKEGYTCGGQAFEDDINLISQMGCASADKSDKLIAADGTFTLTEDEIMEDGSIYLVFKAGSGWGKVTFGDNGLILDNVSITEVLN